MVMGIRAKRAASRAITHQRLLGWDHDGQNSTLFHTTMF